MTKLLVVLILVFTLALVGQQPETTAARCARLSTEVFKRTLELITAQAFADANGDSVRYRKFMTKRHWSPDEQAAYDRVVRNEETPSLRPSDKAWSDENCWAGKPRADSSH